MPDKRVNKINDQLPDSGDDQIMRSTQPRAQIRAAINSIYSTRPATNLASEAAEVEELSPTPKNEKIDATELKRAAQVENLIAKGQTAARNGQPDKARQFLTEAVQRDPENSEAWTWLGGLLIESNLERAQMCLTRALGLDSDNERAKRGLAQIEARLEAETEQSLALNDEDLRPTITVGLEEAVENLRQSGKETDPNDVPMGGARLGSAIEKGEIKASKSWRKARRPKKVKLGVPRGYNLSLVVLSSFLLICVIGVFMSVAPILFAAPPPMPTAAPIDTPPPMTIDETFAGRLRLQIDRYNQFFGSAYNLRLQVQQGKIIWEDYRQAVVTLQTDIRNQNKAVNSIANGAPLRLVPYYRQLQQDVVQVFNQAIDYTVSGVENTNPEDLEEGHRQFNKAGLALASLTQKINEASPIPTPVPTATPRPTATAVPTDTPIPTDTPAPTATITPTVDPKFTPLPPGVVTLAIPVAPIPPTNPIVPLTPIPTSTPSP